MKSIEIRRCSRCILPEQYPNIKFDEQGVCNVCRDYDKNWKDTDFDQLQRELEQKFDLCRKRGRRYDVLVPFSGGRDSSYVLYCCRKIFNLRVLAVTFDNGFFSDYARKNMQIMLEKLKTDHIMYKPRWDVAQRLHRCFFLKAGEFCTPCNVGAKSTCIKFSKKEKIPLIAFGASPRTDECSPIEITYSGMDYFNNIVKDEFSRAETEDWLYKKQEPSLLERIEYKIKGWPAVNLPAYLRWNVEEIISTLHSELGWEKDPDVPDHMDCIMNPLKDYLRQKKMGFGPLTQKYSALIRDGQMKREDALEKIAVAETGDEPPVLPEFLKRLSLSREDFDGFEKRSHLDYIANK